MIELDI